MWHISYSYWELSRVGSDTNGGGLFLGKANVLDIQVRGRQLRSDIN